MQRRGLFLAALALVALGVAGCQENISGGAACPSLCPQERVVLSDTTIDAVALDTTLTPFPAGGTEPYLPIVSREGLETRAIVRFDTLPATWRHTNATVDSNIVRVDSAFVELRAMLPLRDSTSRFTVEAYDVDTTVAGAADTTAAAVLPLFRPDRLIGSLAFEPSALKDSVLRVPINSAVLLKKVQDSTRLRVGLRVRSGDRGGVTLYSSDAGFPPRLTFRVSPDTAQPRVNALVLSKTPPEPSFVTARWADYLLIVQGQGTALPPAAIGVGGLPGRRGYLRFNIPSRILDSSTVVRATLQLVQRPNRGLPDQGDTTVVYAQAVLSSGAITNLDRAAEFIAGPGFFGLDSLRATPADSGKRAFEMAGLLAQWRSGSVKPEERAIVLRSPEEGIRPGGIYFYSLEAPAALRPRLHLTYTTSVPFGLP